MIAAAVAVLVSAYPMSVGPAAYCVERAWISDAVFGAVFSHPLNALPPDSAVHAWFISYVDRWLDLAGKHDGHRELYIF